MIDARTLGNLAREARIDRYTILREYIQILFLDDFYRSEAGRKIIFKGGTALRLLFNSPRFSEDLDFTTKLSHLKIAALVKKTIVNIHSQVPGISVKNIKTAAGFSQKISFPTDFTPMPLTIKLDFSSREPALTNYQNAIATNLPVFSTAIINAFTPEEILAEKLRAISQRNKGRDIFDLYFLLKRGVKLNAGLIAAKFKLDGVKFSLPALIKKVSQINQKQLNQDVTKFLPLQHRQIVPRLKKLTLDLLKQNAA